MNIITRKLDKLFIYFCKSGDLEHAQIMLEDNYNSISIMTKEYAFKEACFNKHINLADWLLFQFEPENTSNIEYYIADTFIESCGNEFQLDIAKWLLQKIPNIEEENFNVAFLKACANGLIHTAKWLLKVAPIIDTSYCDESPFRKACKNGHLKFAKWLLEITPNIDISINEEEIFSEVCSNGHIEIAKWLLQFKPNININAFDDSPFRMSCANGHIEVAKWLLQLNPNITISAGNNYAFRHACFNGKLSTCQWLISLLGPNFNVERYYNGRIFESICFYGKIEVAKWLLNNFPNIDVSTDEELAFKNSCSQGHLELAKWLFEISANRGKLINISIRDNIIFRYTCLNGHLDVAKWLMLQGNVNVIGCHNHAFRGACSNGHLDVAQWLFEICPDMDIEIMDNYAFIKSCENKNIDVALWLQKINPKKYKIVNYDYVLNFIDYVITKTIKKSNDKLYLETLENCPICDEQICQLKTTCQHAFCEVCIETWLSKNKTCPCCRHCLENEVFQIIQIKM